MNPTQAGVLPPPDDSRITPAPSATGQPEFVFCFVTGREEILQAYEASVRRSSQLRPWLRICLVGLGFIWLGGGLANIAGIIQSAPVWQSALFSAMGWMIVWRHLFAPMIQRHKIRASVPISQEFVLKFSEAIIRIEQVGKGQYERNWAELVAFASTDEGVLMWFSDGLEHCVPQRAFHPASQRQAFLSFLRLTAPHAAPKP
ncbi:MAG: YcxB family protein [Verrucomicrobiaceae bacterium]